MTLVTLVALVALVTLLALVVVLKRTQRLTGGSGSGTVSSSHHGRLNSLPLGSSVLEPDFNLHFG